MKPEVDLLIDGMLSGTGIRDAVNGGYIDPSDLGLPIILIESIEEWHKRYEQAFFQNYEQAEIVQQLDKDGQNIAKKVEAALTNRKVGYFSDASLTQK